MEHKGGDGVVERQEELSQPHDKLPVRRVLAVALGEVERAPLQVDERLLLGAVAPDVPAKQPEEA